MNEESLMTYLLHKQSLCVNETIEHLFTGLLNKVFGQKIIKDNKFELTMFIKDLTKKDFEKMIKSIKNFEVNIKDTYDFDKAQVTIGGVDVKEVKKETLELFKLPRVYVTGELLDIDGECGGYNLQWAWTSGYIAGVDIVKKVKEEVC
jgi:predicted flavoprotein YhiN